MKGNALHSLIGYTAVVLGRQWVQMSPFGHSIAELKGQTEAGHVKTAGALSSSCEKHPR